MVQGSRCSRHSGPHKSGVTTWSNSTSSGSGRGYKYRPLLSHPRPLSRVARPRPTPTSMEYGEEVGSERSAPGCLRLLDYFSHPKVILPWMFTHLGVFETRDPWVEVGAVPVGGRAAGWGSALLRPW